MLLPYFLCLLASLLALNVQAQADFPNYAHPLSSPLLVTGTFGELRSDHYHAGIDFRAPTGTPVYSIGDGFVSRIKIQAGGYGQAVYIDHPEGYRSVYAHLSSLAPALLDTIRSIQQATETFELDLHLSPNAFPLAKGDQIGKVGNRGYSFGPHLHFEIRSRQNDAALNPLNFGIKVADSRPPQLRKIKVYEYDNQQQLLRNRAFDLIRQRNGHYKLKDTIVVMANEVAMSIKAYDRQNAMPNYNGPYALQVNRDSITTYAIRFDSIPFEETRCINAHVDYQEWKENKSWYHRLYSLPAIRHSYFEVKNIQPLPQIATGQTEEVSIEVKDWSGNTSLLSFYLRYEDGNLSAQQPSLTYYQLPWAQKSIIERNNLRLIFPKGSLYEDLKFTYASTIDTSSDVFSEVHYLHQSTTPLQLPIQVRINPNREIPLAKRPQLVLAKCDQEGRQISYGTALDSTGNPRHLQVSSLGAFCLMVDDQPPKIKAISRMHRLGKKRRVKFEITDNFGAAGRARGLSYQAKIDGKWVLFEYDLKNDLLYHDLSTPLPKEGVYLRLLVKDGVGNEATWEGRLQE